MSDLSTGCEIVMGTYRLIDHTADVGVCARGKDPDQLFVLCFEGLLEVITGRGSEEIGRKAREKDMEIKSVGKRITGQDIENLLVEYLTEVIYLAEVRRYLVISSSVSVDPDISEATARFDCVPYLPDELGYLTEIKAVTYHGLLIRKCPGGGWGVRVIFDI